MEALKILILSMTAAITYGILQDQVTARLCVEYFTVGHPPVFGTDDPTLLALGWGTIASWWVGVLLGLPLALAARWGKRPKLSARELLKPVLLLMLVIGFTALIAGTIGFFLTQMGAIWLIDDLARRVPPEKHAWFLADGWAHGAAYATGFGGGVVVLVWVYRRRQRCQPSQPIPV